MALKAISANYTTLSAGKTKYIASGIHVANELATNKRHFYCLVARSLTFFSIAGILKKVYMGKAFKNTSSLYLGYFNKLEILGNYANPEVEVDGDPIGFLPSKIEQARALLEIIATKDNIRTSLKSILQF